MIDTKSLREKVLDLAIRGQLVPQDPNDEPASVLLERIREQKQQLVKEGKLKVKDIKNDTIIFKGEDNLHYEKFQDGTVKCIEDEIPFELSNGWIWCRLCNIAASRENSFVDGPFGSNLKTEHYTDNREVRIIQLNNIGEFCWKNLGVKYTTYIHAETIKRCKTYPGDIVIAKMMPAGRAILVPNIEKEYVISSDCVRLTTSNNIDAEYIMYMLNSRAINDQVVRSVHGIGRSRTSLTKLKSLIIPIPPLNEQKLIVKSITNLFSLINSLEDNKEKLIDLSAIIKSKILNLAIRGKLVPQDPNDEPASVLLERIRAEKEELIKQGQIKHDKKKSIIFRGEDNSYYEKFSNGVVKDINDLPYIIPENWAWVRFSNVTINRDNERKPISLKDRTKISKIYDYYGASGEIDKVDDYLFNERLLLIGEDGANLVTRSKPIAFFAEGKYWVNNHAHCIDATNKKHLDFICLYINSINLEKYITGAAQPKLNQENMSNILLPFPPFEEQKRIIKKVKYLYTLIEHIEKSL